MPTQGSLATTVSPLSGEAPGAISVPGVLPAFQNTGLRDKGQEKEQGRLPAPRVAGAAGRGAQA